MSNPNIYKQAINKLKRNTYVTVREYNEIINILDKLVDEVVEQAEGVTFLSRIRYIITSPNKVLTYAGFKDISLDKHKLAGIRSFPSMSHAKQYMESKYPDIDYNIEKVIEKFIRL